MTSIPDSPLDPPGVGEPRPPRIRYDLPAQPLALASARLAAANATLAEALGGELIVVRPSGAPSRVIVHNLELLAWLGLDWAEASLDGLAADAAIVGLAKRIAAQPGERDAIRRIGEDRALGITHAILPLDCHDVAALAERVGGALDWHPTVYLFLGMAESPSDDTPTSLGWYRERGYLPQALRAYLAASACWPTPPTDVDAAKMLACYRRAELSHAVWSPNGEQIRKVGRHAMREADAEYIGQRLRARFQRFYGRWHRASDTSHRPEEWFSLLARALQQEAVTLDEATELARFAFVDRVGTMTSEATDALRGPRARAVLAGCLEDMDPGKLATPDSAKLFFQQLRHRFRDTMGLRGRHVMFPIRAALTGTLVGPCLGIVASLLGYERCYSRLREALNGLQNGAGDKA